MLNSVPSRIEKSESNVMNALQFSVIAELKITVSDDSKCESAMITAGILLMH